MPRSVGPGGPRATAEPLDQVLVLMVLVMLMLLKNYDLDGICKNTQSLRIQSKAFQRPAHSGMRSSELLRKSVGKNIQ